MAEGFEVLGEELGGAGVQGDVAGPTQSVETGKEDTLQARENPAPCLTSAGLPVLGLVRHQPQDPRVRVCKVEQRLVEQVALPVEEPIGRPAVVEQFAQSAGVAGVRAL